MNSLYAKLQWLPSPPADFSKKLKDVGNASESLGNELRALALHSLNLNQLTKLAKVIARARTEERSLAPLLPFRLVVLSNATIDLIVPALEATAARHGIALEVIQPAFDQAAQVALAPDSILHRAKPDAVLLALDYHAFPLKLSPGDTENSNAITQKIMNHLQMLCDGIKSNSDAVCIVQNFAPPAETLFGSLDRTLAGTRRNLLDNVNCRIAEFVQESGNILLDVAVLAETVGLAEWHDPQLWNVAKLPFSDALIPLYADHVTRTIAAMRGRSCKALILDLDNTLWGGMIGEDGLEGIQFTQGDANGEAYLAVQRLALELRQRGIILAVSSKNTEEIARQPFNQHPEMLLKLEHFAAFKANWKDKATNIQEIADELSLSLDAMVFLDDNPAERALVRALLPQVSVPELPGDPSYYARTLAAAGYFEAISFAPEDCKRASFYQDNVKRDHLQKQLGSLDAYLESLEMTLTFQPFDAAGRARIVQLINKSNQYNLTKRQYSDLEVMKAENDPSVFTLQMRLVDIFGDNGMIGVVICRPCDNSAWEIDTWLMSFRVLGR
jgi:FkbH-like protein